MPKHKTRAKAQQILRAAERLFTKRRFHEVKMDDVSAAAGVGKGTIYRYFEDKNDLFVQVVLSGFDELCACITAIACDDLPFEQQLADAVSAIRSFFIRRRPLFRVMHSEHARLVASRGDIHSRWRRRWQEMMRAIARIIRNGVATGAVRPDVRPDVLARALLGILHGHAHNAGRRSATRRTTGQVIDLFLNGAARRTASTRTRRRT